MTKKPNQALTVRENIFYLSGDLTFATVTELWKASQILFLQQAAWNCDFSQVKACDSAGLALIIEWIKAAKKQKKSLSLGQLPQQLCSLAAASGLDTLVQPE
jgi:phospholipid transport system transporter-binding protein